jgi:hypothetical protein
LIHQIICGAGGVSLVTAPRIIQRIFFQAGPYRIQVDVGGKFQKIGVLFAENGLVSPLKEVAPTPIFQIVMSGISKLQALHDFRQRGLLDLHQEMNMAGHKDISIEEEGIPLFVLFQEPQIESVILSGSENLCALIPPRDDVIKSSCKMNPRLPRHDQLLSNGKTHVSTYFLMPDPLSYCGRRFNSYLVSFH